MGIKCQESPCIMSVQYTGTGQYIGACSLDTIINTVEDIMSTPEGVKCTGGYHSVHWVVFSTPVITMRGGYHKYTEGSPVHWGATEKALSDFGMNEEGL